MSTEPCGGCQLEAWKRWADKVCLGTGAMPEGKPRLCDPCRERLGRIAALYQPKGSPA
jgi:hypothetical protein